MNQINFTKKAVVLSVLFTVVILCGMMLFAASTSSGNLIPQTRTPEGAASVRTAGSKGRTAQQVWEYQ